MFSLQKILGEPEKTLVPGLFSAATWFLSSYFEIPYGREYYRFCAVLGMLAGYAIGNACFSKRRESVLGTSLISIGTLVIGIGLATAYTEFVGTGHVSTAGQNVFAVTMLALAFLCIGLLVQVAGVRFDEQRDSSSKNKSNATG
jgi:hypothetical protein